MNKFFILKKAKIIFFFVCLISKNLYCIDKKNEREATLIWLSMQSTAVFAQDPRKLDHLLQSCPKLENNTYFKCVKSGFAKHPELGKPIPTFNLISYQLGLRSTIPSNKSFFDALHIQFECLKPIASLEP